MPAMREIAQISAPLQRSLLTAARLDGTHIAGPLDEHLARHWIDDHCWIDIARSWFLGADDALGHLVESLDWYRRTRPMYDRIVEEPRLTASIERDDSRLGPLADDVLPAICAHYPHEFGRIGLNYYRDGNDSVAWHSDRIGRYEVNPLVVIVSLGGPRQFRLRPKGRGTSRVFQVASGDVLVMGGATQHSWEHCVPKARTAAPRISVTFRSLPRLATLHANSESRDGWLYDDDYFGRL